MSNISNHLPDIVFWIFCLVTLAGALYVLLSDHVLYAAFGLLVSFLGVAALFVFGHAEFVSAAQIMIYVGGILILLLFGIMLSSNKKQGVEYLKIENASRGLSLIIVFALSIAFLLLISRLKLPREISLTENSIKDLGFTLMTGSVLILEVIGMLLLMALIGATYIAKDDK